MATPTAIVAYLALFAGVGILFLFVNMLVGRLVRPSSPNDEKQEIYECGEPTIGSSFIQFDLRFYVVALLFIIFDVEVAFFFPWGTVFGKATQLASPQMQVMAATSADGAEGTTTGEGAEAVRLSAAAMARHRELGIAEPTVPTLSPQEALRLQVADDPTAMHAAAVHQSARRLALTSLADIGVFFGVLLVGFAYVWRRGDLDWVRSTSSQQGDTAGPSPSS